MKPVRQNRLPHSHVKLLLFLRRTSLHITALFQYFAQLINHRPQLFTFLVDRDVRVFLKIRDPLMVEIQKCHAVFQRHAAVGVLLAKRLGYSFIDVDLLIGTGR